MKNKKYHAVGTIQISNIKLEERAKIDIPTKHINYR
jgi:hypothetical protein